MRLDGTIFAIEPRTIGGCIDLAIVFLREHFVAMVALLACFLIPSAALTWWLVDSLEWPTTLCLLLLLIETPFFGAALVVTAGRRSFGDDFSVATGLRGLLKRLPLYFVLTGIVRVGMLVAGCFLVFPAYLLATRYGFLAEVLFLEGTPARKYESRLGDLLSGTFFNLFGRLLSLMSFFTVSICSLFVLIDLGAGTLFGFPILIGRFTSLEDVSFEIEQLLMYDARVATTLVIVCWLVYAVTRLAWMFCYLDVRIRKEGWDIELDVRVEGRRLEAAV